MILHHGSRPNCTIRRDITELDHLHSRLKLDFHSHLWAGTVEKGVIYSYRSYLYVRTSMFGYFWFRCLNPCNSESPAFVFCLVTTGLHNALLHNENVQTAMVVHFGLLVFSSNRKVHVASCSETSLNAFKQRRFS